MQYCVPVNEQSVHLRAEGVGFVGVVGLVPMSHFFPLKPDLHLQSMTELTDIQNSVPAELQSLQAKGLAVVALFTSHFVPVKPALQLQATTPLFDEQNSVPVDWQSLHFNAVGEVVVVPNIPHLEPVYPALQVHEYTPLTEEQ